MHLPRLQACTLRYLQQIMAEEKLFFRETEIKSLNVPLWPELSVKRIFPAAERIIRFGRYIPDDWTADKKTERNFFWSILITIAPEFVEQIVTDCRTQRYQRRQDNVREPTNLQISAQWAGWLLAEPFQPSKYPSSVLTSFRL